MPQYSDEQRQVLEYFDGEKKVFGDPLEILGEVMILTGGNPDILTRAVFGSATSEGEMKSPTQAMSERYDAQKKMVQIVRKVWRMKDFNPVDGTGAVVAHCLTAWRELARWLNKKKEKDENSPTESASSAGPQG